MKTAKFKVLQSNPTEKDTFVTKLQREVIVKDDIFGDKVAKQTVYISGPKKVEVPEVDVDFDKYHIIERPFDINGETVMLKWLTASIK